MIGNRSFFRRARPALLLALALCVAGLSIPRAAADQKEGVVRVLLTRLKLTDQIELSLDGSYSVGGIAFQRGSDVLVSSKTGRLILYYEGMALDAGERITFSRHATDTNEENGVRVGNELYLHPGDLVLTIRDGQLRCVLYAPLEEYLLGVVPYEMSDSFPLEALKAQAVAARTYALKKMGSTQDYDVVDNTNDQAYYGVLASNQNAARAVKETKGIAGYYKGQLAMCYYTASNGGQVELVENAWSAGDYGYITQHDDPYDVENAESVVKSASIKKIVRQETDLKGLAPLLKAGIAEQLEALGYDGDEKNIRIDQVTGISLLDPKYGIKSKVMTKVRFALSVSGRKVLGADAEEDITLFAAPTATPEVTVKPDPLGPLTAIDQPFYAELSYFGEVEAPLGLSINGSDNEIVTVQETETALILSARRYGHGVGMSQRGAQTLAGDYRWTYTQILSFYYPGMTLKTVEYTYQMPTPLSSAFLTTPGPPATPTPRPPLLPATAAMTDGQYKVRVDGISANSSLNLREKADLTSAVLMRLYYGQELIVLAENEGWLHVKTDAAEGYIMAQYATKIEP